jgi:hypothetical protein
MKEEGLALYRKLSSPQYQAGGGGFWAYDTESSKSESEHSVNNWHFDIVATNIGEKNRAVKVSIWNDTRLRTYFNYVKAIGHNDLSPKTLSSEYMHLKNQMRDNIVDRVRHIKGIH